MEIIRHGFAQKNVYLHNFFVMKEEKIYHCQAAEKFFAKCEFAENVIFCLKFVPKM